MSSLELFLSDDLNIYRCFAIEMISYNYSLNSWYISINSFFYFNITSHIFLLFFTFSTILLGFLWGKSKEDMSAYLQLVIFQNWIFYSKILNRSPERIQYLISEYKVIFKETYGQNVDELLDSAGNSIFWWEPWSYETLAFFPPFDKKFFNSPWHFYYKYRLSSWVRWHILEDRICIFVLFFLWILI
jgi:hypothetical protein